SNTPEELKSAPRRFTLIDERDRRYPRVTGHGGAMSRLDADSERSARYQGAQNGVVATSLRSTLQRWLYVVDPPVRWAKPPERPSRIFADEDATRRTVADARGG
ncbi:Uncharacterized protein DBV15_04493, partial [Temnothorax longispinosus]